MTTLDQFKKFLSLHPTTVVYFSSKSCKPCAALSQVFHQFLLRYTNLIEIDVSESYDIAIQYKITNVPMVAAFAEYKILESYIGTDKNKFSNFVNKYAL